MISYEVADQLPGYINKFKRLRVDRSKGQPAPHKPILLLSIIQEIEVGNITENKIYITPELVARFKNNFRVVNSGKFTSNFSLPFYHLKSEGFWHFNYHIGRHLQLTSSFSIKSLKQVQEVIEYAYLDNKLFLLLIQNETRDILKDCIIETYFHKELEKETVVNNYYQQVEQLLLNEPAVVYKKEILSLDEEEIFIRKGAFKKIVPRIYNQCCCISQMRIISSLEIQMVDACHIVPFSESHDDTITNGISLCPNLHRAFDRGLITIDNEFKLLVSDKFSEAGIDYSIAQYANKKLMLPLDTKYYPAINNLEWHRQHIFKN
ncbi:MAG: restriction endonuclease [Ferruginibacter sp.]|nr:restriction endonuclease [Ferruginibacter sp.]